MHDINIKNVDKHWFIQGIPRPLRNPKTTRAFEPSAMLYPEPNEFFSRNLVYA